MEKGLKFTEPEALESDISLINKIKEGTASPEEISKLEMKTGFTSEELTSVEDYNHEMFSEGGGDTTFLILNSPPPTAPTSGMPPMGKASRPGKTEYVPTFDPMRVVQLHTIHSLRT